MIQNECLVRELQIFSSEDLTMKFWRLNGFMTTGGPAVRGHAWNCLSVASHHSLVATVLGVFPEWVKSSKRVINCTDDFYVDISLEINSSYFFFNLNLESLFVLSLSCYKPSQDLNKYFTSRRLFRNWHRDCLPEQELFTKDINSMLFADVEFCQDFYIRI